MRLRARSRLGLTLGALPVGLLLAEIGVRVLGIAPVPLPVRHGGVWRDVDDPIQIFENQPGAVMVTEYRDQPDGSVRTVEQHVNAQGFRGPEVLQRKPAGTLRIACIGDSHTFGDGVGDDATYPAYLERVLRERSSTRPVEVLNAGVNGYDTLQEVIWLERTVLEYEPDAVVLQYYVNDTAARNLRDDGRAPHDRLLEWTAPRKKGFVTWLRSISRLGDLACDGVWRWRVDSQYSEMRQKLYAEDSPGWLRVQSALRRARDGLRARGIRFGVVLYPFLVRRDGRLTSHDAFELVKQFCAREGIVCLDTEPAFEGLELEPLRVSALDYHANARANEIFARAVATWLQQSGWLE